MLGWAKHGCVVGGVGAAQGDPAAYFGTLHLSPNLAALIDVQCMVLAAARQQRLPDYNRLSTATAWCCMCLPACRELGSIFCGAAPPLNSSKAGQSAKQQVQAAYEALIAKQMAEQA